MKKPDILLAITPVIRAFDELSVPYYLGGSIASSVHGIARATMDADIVADMRFAQVSPLVMRLRDEYYIDEQMINEAITRVSSFNLIHLETMMKVDVFIQKTGAYHKSALGRRAKDRLVEDDEDSAFWVSSPEDIILSKLQWYQLSGAVSERQWLDVLGVIKVQGDSLDMKYLCTWSVTLGLLDLLKRAFSEAGVQL